MMLLLALFAIVLAILQFLPPVPQDPAYHVFAATAPGPGGIPNAENVLTNLPFAVAGLYGLVVCRELPDTAAKACWICFFVGLFLVAPGSAWYHWNPGNTTLVWDRLPMTIAFMGLFTAILEEYLSPGTGSILLLPAVIAGIGSVIYWHLFDDLRYYAMIQFFPLLAIPLVMLTRPAEFTLGRFLFYGLLFYLLAKLCEAFDRQILDLTGFGGHGLKHLFAAVAAVMVLLMLKFRKPATHPERESVAKNPPHRDPFDQA